VIEYFGFAGENSPESLQTAATIEDLTSQLQQLHSMLEAKTEQNATLRSVLKSNKHAAEKTLTNLKSKYDTEKQIVSETMVKLRHELRLLKEDAATFASKLGKLI